MRRMVLVLSLAWLALGCTSADDPDAVTLTTSVTVAPEVTASTAQTGQTARADHAIVTGVTDGDTVDVSIGGRDDTVRLIGINSPETGECFAAEATAALSDLVGGRTVRLRRDQSDRDQYGRLLRFVSVDDTEVNETMVRRGFAIAYPFEPDTTRADRFAAAQAAAEADQVGLWAPDACGRPAASDHAVAIARIEADPPGDDTLDANAEWVAVRNGGTGAVDLTGWGLKDETSSHRFTFPAGFALAAGATVTVHTGCGQPTTTELFWCNEGSAIWNNDGDTAFLLDPNGNVVDTRSY